MISGCYSEDQLALKKGDYVAIKKSGGILGSILALFNKVREPEEDVRGAGWRCECSVGRGTSLGTSGFGWMLKGAELRSYRVSDFRVLGLGWRLGQLC